MHASQRRPRYLIGLDLGQAADPTAICVLARTLVPTGRRVLDQAAAIADAWADHRPLHPPTVAELAAHYAAVHLERLPLGTSYVQVVAAVRDVVRHVAPLDDRAGQLASPLPLLAVDGTGVGRPVVDMLARARLPADLVPILITGGTTATVDEDGYAHVPKRDLVGVTRLLLESGRLQWAADLPEARVLEAELANFRTRLTATAHDTYNAREGAHDDLLLALACAAWAGEYVL